MIFFSGNADTCQAPNLVATLEKQREELKRTISALRQLADHPSGTIRDLSLHDHEKRLLEEALHRADGNQTEAARILNVSRDKVRYKMAKYGLLRKK